MLIFTTLWPEDLTLMGDIFFLPLECIGLEAIGSVGMKP